MKEVISVDDSTAVQEPPRRPTPERPASTPAGESGSEEFGTVKFYAAAKRFGFIILDNGGNNVFVHGTVLSRAGLLELADGQRVAVVIGQGRRGLEVVSLRLA